ncbi:MAG: NADH-quinone oxidoreductase subunit M [Verrucomicrobiota bacterium]
MNDLPLLTFLTFAPLLGGLLVMGLPAERPRLVRGIALAFALATLAIAAFVWTQFDATNTDLQWVEKHPWIASLAVDYFVGVDGLSLLLVLLTALLVPMAMLSSWQILDKPQIYFGLMLLLESGLLGTFTALNFFHWFLFWELSLIPAFFLVRLWGGPNRSAASMQFFVYTMVGSVALLLSFLALFVGTGKFDFLELAELGRQNRLPAILLVKLGWYSLSTEQLMLVIFLGGFLGFAVKVPLMPFHTWLPATYAEAPTGTTMLLTGAMSKMGVYGFLRILLPIFPEQMRAIQTPLLWLAVATIVFSACAAFAQKDLKRMLAYSSINHLGYCLLGTFVLMGTLSGDAARLAVEQAAALNGVLLQMFNHGVTAAALFCFLGFLEQRSGGLRGVDQFGGLRKVAPVFCGLMGISLFASLGLPGLNGFVGEFLIFKGAFSLSAWATALATIGLLVTAIFLLTILQRVFNGPLNPQWQRMPDLTLAEKVTILPAVILMFAIGIYPQILIETINPTVMRMIDHIKL